MSAPDVIAIRWERERGSTLKDIAKKYGVSEGHASRIVRGEFYPHIGGPIIDKTPAAKTHCVRGHEYTPDNTVITSSGRRNCRHCKNTQSAASKHRKREASRG